MGKKLSPYEFVCVITDASMGTLNMRLLDNSTGRFQGDVVKLSSYKEVLESADTYTLTEAGKIKLGDDGGGTIEISFVDETDNSIQRYPQMKKVWPFTGDTNE